MSKYRLVPINIKQEAKKFAELLIELVPHMIDYSLEDEIKKIRKQKYTKPNWILNEFQEIIGTIKVRRDNTFYGFGLKNGLTSDDITEILKTIENELNFWFKGRRYYGTINRDMLEIAKSFDFKVEFSRYKMCLDLNNIQNTASYEDIKLEKYTDSMLKPMVDMFIDAYTGTVDERVGMFNPGIAHSALNSVLDGNFGEFKPELSLVCYNSKNDIIGASLISNSRHNIPLVVIIGVSHSLQGKGLGRKLLTANSDLCIKSGFEKLSLWVTTENEKAVNLYHSMGFKIINQIYSVYKY